MAGPLLWLYGSACLLLVLTCANLASLFVARSSARSHETGVHLALGANRWRLLRGRLRTVWQQAPYCWPLEPADFFGGGGATRPACRDLNRAAAGLLFHGEALIGCPVHSGFMDRRSVVIGLVQDIRTHGLDRKAAPMVYLPYLPLGEPEIHATDARRDGALRTLAAGPRERLEFGGAAAKLPPSAGNPGRDTPGPDAGGCDDRRFCTVGLIVSSVGRYGTLTAYVQQRLREIGIRMALGGTPASLVRDILAEGQRIMALGTATGLVGSAVAMRLVRPQL
jgi:hypothetical protein